MKQLPTLRQDRADLSEFKSAIAKEWLITNGLGGYASSSILGVNTRKYHGLLVAALHPPTDRRVLLTKLDDEVVTADKVWRLGANEFKDTFFPEGYRFLEEFSLSSFPTFNYSIDSVKIVKKVFMPHGQNSVIALYDVSNPRENDIKLRVFPVVSGRGFNDITDSRTAAAPGQRMLSDLLRLDFKSPQSTLLIKASEGRYVFTGHWVEKIYLREEDDRGETCFDDCYQPGYFEIDVRGGEKKSLGLCAVAGEDAEPAEGELGETPATLQEMKQSLTEEESRLSSLIDTFHSIYNDSLGQSFVDWLVLAAESFIVTNRDKGGRSIVAGYHWFGPWGRDTFISLPGLMLVTRRFDDAKAVFLSFADLCKDGLIPNFISEENTQPGYNTVDATLWYVNAVLQYLKYTGDFEFVKSRLWDVLKRMIEKHVEGTLFDIGLAGDGLLSHGPQLTWMDSQVAGKPVFPRVGKAVEVQALWFNALKTMELLGNVFGEDQAAEEYHLIAENTHRSFVEKFWIEEKGFLYDVVHGEDRDISLRPNQVLAASVDFSMLDISQSARMVDVVRKELLTPCGLRSLAKSDPRYIREYRGDRVSRDTAYHSGTVWPWLLGPLTTAFLRARGYVKSERSYAFENFLRPFLTNQIFTAGLGTLSEIYDGDPPHLPRGCISQAWSVAEPLRACVEDVSFIRPKHEKTLLERSG